MLWGYKLSQWIGLIEWFGIILILGVGVFIISCILANKTLNKKNKRTNKKSDKRKKIFIDVA